MAGWHRSSANKLLSRQAQAHRKRTAFRSLTLPRKNSSVLCGSLQVSHSVSVMASLLPQDQIHYPAASNMQPWPPAMGQDFRVGAASIFQNVSQHRETVEGTVIVNSLGEA